MTWLLAILAQLTDSAKQGLLLLCGCVAFLLVVLTACLCMLFRITVEAAFFTSLSLLICAFAGINTAQFFKYRESDYEAIRLRGEAAAKVAAATTPSAVSVTTPTTTVNTPTPSARPMTD